MKSSKIKKIRTSSSRVQHRTRCLTQKNRTVSNRGPRVLLEDHLATEMSLKHSFDLKKEDRGRATILVGETREIFVLIISATSTSTKRNWSKGSATILVGETRRLSILSVRIMEFRTGNQHLLPIDQKLWYDSHQQRRVDVPLEDVRN